MFDSDSIIFCHVTKDIKTNKMCYLQKIPITVLLTQDLTPLHVISGLKQDQRPKFRFCMHHGLPIVCECPKESTRSFSLSSSQAQQTAGSVCQYLRMNCLQDDELTAMSQLVEMAAWPPVMCHRFTVSVFCWKRYWMGSLEIGVLWLVLQP